MITVEKNEQYAYVILDTDIFDATIAAEIEKKISGFYREGYTNFIFKFDNIKDIKQEGLLLIRKIEKICSSENGLVVFTTQNAEIINLLDQAKLEDLAIFSTKEEAVEAIYINELENDFRDEEEAEEYGSENASD